MPVPNRPTTGQKATITRGLNLQAATKKDVELLGKQMHSIEKRIAKVQNTQTKIFARQSESSPSRLTRRLLPQRVLGRRQPPGEKILLNAIAGQGQRIAVGYGRLFKTIHPK